VAERLGVGPKDCHAENPKLVYGRMTGWGQTGPWAKTAGHDINYISITGALEAMGVKGNKRTGKGDIVDAAIIDGTSSMMGIVYTLHALGQWREDRQSNLLDGAMPYYRCYETSDGKHMSIPMNLAAKTTQSIGPRSISIWKRSL